MKRKIILFGAFLSTFILILVPSISCVNANIQNENNLNTKNINIDDIKTIINRLKDSDCNCHRTANDIHSKPLDWELLCDALYDLIYILLEIALKAYDILGILLGYLLFEIFWIPAFCLALIGEKILDCDWYYLLIFNKVFTNNEQILYNFSKFSYLGLGDL